MLTFLLQLLRTNRACPVMSLSLLLHQVSSPSHAGPIRHASYRDPPPRHSAPYRQTGARTVRQRHVFVSIALMILIRLLIPCLQSENGRLSVAQETGG